MEVIAVVGLVVVILQADPVAQVGIEPTLCGQVGLVAMAQVPPEKSKLINHIDLSQVNSVSLLSHHVR